MNVFALARGNISDQGGSPGRDCLLLSGFGVRVPDGALFPQVTVPTNDLQTPKMISSVDLTSPLATDR